MFSFKTFTDKRYWILLLPFTMILVGFSVFGSTYFIENTYFLPFFLISYAALFWTTYHLWKYFGDKKDRNNNDHSF